MIVFAKRTLNAEGAPLINLSVISAKAEGIFDGSLESSGLDLDEDGGRMFLRVLLHLVMHDYPPLVSGALQLLFRHFSQRQEVLQAFKNVSAPTVPVISGCFLHPSSPYSDWQ